MDKSGIDKRDLILEATLKLVLEGGFYHLNMKKVSKESGVAAGTIYLYFTSKDQLIVELYFSVVEQYVAAVMSGYSPESDLGESIRAMCRNYLQFFVNRPDCFSFLLQYSFSPFVFNKANQRIVLLTPMYELVEQARASGILKDLSPFILVALVAGPITDTLRLWQEGIVDMQPELQEQLLYACWQSIAR